jgi:hypothetical protein
MACDSRGQACLRAFPAAYRALNVRASSSIGTGAFRTGSPVWTVLLSRSFLFNRRELYFDELENASTRSGNVQLSFMEGGFCSQPQMTNDN